MTEVKKRKGESFDSLFRRFKQRLQLSGRVLQAKKIRFYKEEPNKTEMKDRPCGGLSLKHYDELQSWANFPKSAINLDEDDLIARHN